MFLKLERQQFRAIRIALGYRISTPINVMLTEAKEVPLKIRFTYLIDKYLYKVYSHKFSIVTRSLRSIDISTHSDAVREKARKTLPVYDRYCATKHVLDRIHRSTFLPAFDDTYQLSIYKKDIDLSLTDIQKDTPSHIARAKFEEHFEELSLEATSFYTNGSRSDYSPVGAAGIYSPSIDFIITHKLPSFVSIFTAEVWAILHAIIAIIDLNITEANIFTDSRSVLMALASSDHKQGNYLIHRIKKKLIAAEREGRKIILCWVPAHKGIPGNEKADRLAKWATTRSAKPAFEVPFSDLQVEAKLHQTNSYKHYLEEISLVKGTQYSELYLNDSQKTWYFNKGLNREEIVSISRIRSNHYNLNYSLFRKNIVDSPECPCGESRVDQFYSLHCAIDGKHVTIQCPNNAGSTYYNYKNAHSVVLMAICDARYLFRFVDIGAYGRRSDGGIFGSSVMGKNFNANGMNVPKPSAVAGGRILPYCLVGDEAFPLKPYMLRPYPGKNGLSQEQDIFNYRLTRARRMIEKVSRVGMRMPEFTPADPELWFSIVDRSFQAAGITVDATKFGYALTAIGPRYTVEVRDVIMNSPAENAYETLKAELIKRLSLSQEHKTRRLLEHEEIGDRKPSKFLRHLRSLAGSVVGDGVLRTIWLSRLPAYIQPHLVNVITYLGGLKLM
ncbi:PREDICTED: uncharacterized protein LOC105461018 [Wasmannia auropunctata]|uniref:uncharacterized protein LOC105461018 n=1 Tax=Wasmannia auropunctata TaxID=64793 RepID=UPI0005EDAE06|nr:PREDICTED: uncharacterized protein LOC105461018 [Wasmannia auropunctata]